MNFLLIRNDFFQLACYVTKGFTGVLANEHAPLRKELFSAFPHPTNLSRGYPGNKRVWFNVFRYDGPCGNNGPFSNNDRRNAGCMGTNGSAVTNFDSLGVPII
jgi:hypothetical protein